ncbi:uncharacterized protein PFB0765w-like isoform X2 [Pseudomyrmex gracilis]|nr:uncharacterized protein PFB0765w-like isoform X2 [Pseudomyrmex gracilis]
MLAAQSTINSPLRRSSRIRQTMESASIETLKRTQYTRRTSVSSDISETRDVEFGTSKRTTRRSVATTFSPSTRITRTLSKHLTRAGSETKSPSVSPLRTCRTRASSVGMESASVKRQSQSGPIKLHKQTTMLPSHTLLREDSEDNKLLLLDDVIGEIEKYTEDSEDNKLLLLDDVIGEIEKYTEDSEDNKFLILDDVIVESEEYTGNSSSSLDKTLHIGEKDKKKSLNTKQYNSEECLLHDVTITEDIPNKSPNALKKDKNDKLDIKISNLSEVQISLIDIRKNEKELGVKIENILNTSIEEEKRSLGNKENQTLNITSSTSIEKNVQPINTMPLLNTDSLTSTVNINKTLNEKENKPTLILNEVSLDKQLDSRSSIEASVKHNALLQDIDSNVEKMNISINSLTLNLTDNKNNLDTSLRSDASEKRSSHHDVDSKSSVDNTNKLILIENDTIELSDKSIIAKETSIENKSEPFEDIIEEAFNKSDENKDSKKSIVTEINEMSNSSINQIPDKWDSTESLIFIQTLDNNTKILEQRSPCSSTNEVSSIVDRPIANHSRQLSNDAENLPSNDKSSDDDQSIIQSSISRDDVTNNSPKEKQKTLFEQTDCVYVVPEIINSSFKNLNADNTIQDTQSPDILKLSEKSVTKIAEDNSDLDIGIELFQDVPTEKWGKQKIEKNDKVEPSSQVTEKLETRNSERLETQNCDLVLVDKQAWYEAKNMEETKEQNLLEYDSDTILSKNQLETAKTSFSDAKRLSILNQKTDLDNEKTKTVKLNKKKKLLIKRRSASQKYKNSSSECEEEEDSLSIANKSSEQLETAALNQCNTSKLFKSERANITEQIFQVHDISNKEIEDNTDRSQRSLSASEKNTLLQKSTEKRESLNKSMKDTPSKQSNIQDLYINQSQIHTSEEDFDNADAHIKKKAKKKRSLNKSNNIDNNIRTACNNIVTEKGNISLSKDNIEEDTIVLTHCLINKKSKALDINKILPDLNDEISNNVNIIRTIDLGFKNKSTLTVAKLPSDTDFSDNNESAIPQFLCAQSSEDNNKDDKVDDSIDPDIKKEYNLFGMKQKFSDDDALADECRDSEVEFSNPDDHGSDLIDFIVDDDDENIQNEKNEENKDVEDIEDNKDIESEEQYMIKDNEFEKKEANYDQQTCKIIEHCMESNNEEDVNEENDKEDAYKMNSVKIKITDVTKGLKINKNKKSKKSPKTISSSSESKTKRYVEATKSPVNKTEENILLDVSTLTSSFEQKKELNPQCSLKRKAEQTLTKQINTSAIESKKIIRPSVAILGCSTPKLNLQNKKSQTVVSELQSDNSSNVEIKKRVTFQDIETNNQTTKKNLKKNIKLDKIDKLIQNTLSNKKKSMKISERDINLDKLNYTNGKKQILNANSANNAIQESSQQKKKKRKRQEKEMWDEDATDELVLQEMKELNIPKKKRYVKVDSMQTRDLKVKSENLEPNTVQLQNAELKSTSFKMQNKEDFSTNNYKVLKKKSKQEIENKKILSQKLSKKKKKEDNTLPLQSEAMEKSVILKSDKRAKSKLTHFTETQNEETISSTNNYMTTKKKERKTGNKKETWLEKPLKKKKAKQILPLEIGTPTLKEQETDKGTSAEKLLKEKKKARKILLLETESATFKSDLQSNKLRSQNYVPDLVGFFKLSDEKKDLSIVNYKDMHKKFKQKKLKENKEYCLDKLSEKKKEVERTAESKPEISKLKSDKKVKSGKLQLHNIMLHSNRSKSSFEAQDKALKDIHTTNCITANEELKKIKKRKLQDIETNKDQDKNEIPVKKKKKEGKIKEKSGLSSSTETLKRLPDSVIVNLAEVPKKKRQKISRDEEQVTPENTEKLMTNENSIPSNFCNNHISRINVVSLKKIKKQSSTGIATVVSAKRHISKNREPISAYISYLQKQRAASKNKFSTNAF